MAYGNELMFVLDWPVLTRLAREHVNQTPRPEHVSDDGIEFVNTDYLALDNDDDRSEWCYIVSSDANARVEKQLADVHLQLVRSHFDLEARFGDNDYILANTGAGPREFSTFNIAASGPEDGPLTYGISILSRYFPVWVDWRTTHGGSNDPVILNVETLEMAELARAAIRPVIPEIKDAPLGVVFTHY